MADAEASVGPRIAIGDPAPAPAAPPRATMNIEGVAVTFPFAPYAVQTDYMRTVVKALQHCSNALLESPTGTGKTLCLLCATLAWHLQTPNDSRPAGANPMPAPALGGGGGGALAPPAATGRRRIVYASRTHAQLSQVIQQFLASGYAGLCRMAILGSRDHLCVHHDVKKLPPGAAQNQACRQLVTDRQCRYHRGVHKHIEAEEARAAADVAAGAGEDGGVVRSAGLYDVEDLCKSGRADGFCPYFFEREMAQKADIVFVPYNYVCDPQLAATQLPFSLEDAVIIVDEAHNLPGYFGRNLSVELSPADIAQAIADTNAALSVLEKEETAEDAPAELVEVSTRLVQDVSALNVICANLERVVAKTVQENPGAELIRGGPYVESILAQAQITRHVVTQLTDTCTADWPQLTAAVVGTARRRPRLKLGGASAPASAMSSSS